MISVAELLAILVLVLVLGGGSITWFLFVRNQDRERLERERRFEQLQHEQQQHEQLPSGQPPPSTRKK